MIQIEFNDFFAVNEQRRRIRNRLLTILFGAEHVFYFVSTERVNKRIEFRYLLRYA